MIKVIFLLLSGLKVNSGGELNEFIGEFIKEVVEEKSIISLINKKLKIIKLLVFVKLELMKKILV